MKQSPEEVKTMIADDLKSRHLTHQKIADMMGLSRQTVGAILSSKEYFSERHATLFSICLGYSRYFLQTGEGPLKEEAQQQDNENKILRLERVLSLYCQTMVISQFVLNYTSSQRENDERNDELIGQIRLLLNLFSPVSMSAKKLYDIRNIEAIESSFNLVIEDTLDLINEKCSIDLHPLISSVTER